MKKNKFPIAETLIVTGGELIAAAITCFIIIAIRGWEVHYSIFTGSALGIAVMIANFIFLIISTNTALDRAMAERVNREYTEEEAEEFAKKHKAKIALVSRVSYILRTATMIGALVVAFLIKDGMGENVFNVIATLVPLIAFYPIIFVAQIILQRRERNG